MKTREWSYEREWRVMSYSLEGEPECFTDTGFHPAELEAVFLGAAMPGAERTEIAAMLVDDLAHVQIWEASLDHTERRVSFNRIR